MTDFLQDRDLVAHVLDLLQSDYVDHGENFQGERLAAMPAENHSAKRACAYRDRRTCIRPIQILTYTFSHIRVCAFV